MTEPLSRIEAALARLGAEHEPPVGWEARVLAATAPAPRKRSRWWWLSVPVGTVGAVAGLLLWLVPARGLALNVAFASPPGGAVVRGSSPHRDEVMQVTATGGDRYREIRIYVDDELVLMCPRDPTCHGSERADLALSRTGTYRVMALTSSSPIPPPNDPAGASGPRTLDRDLAQVRDAGLTPKESTYTVR